MSTDNCDDCKYLWQRAGYPADVLCHCCELRERISALEAKLRLADELSEAVNQYELETANPAPDYMLRSLRRKQVFAALKAYREAK